MLLVSICGGAIFEVDAATQPIAEQVKPEATFEVDGGIALASLTALSDGHLRKLADSLQILAESDAAQSGQWEEIHELLRFMGERNVAALNWFALPDGSYWSVQEGRVAGKLADRPYFPKLLAGEVVVGELVVSRATGKSVAIVAVPVFNEDGSVAGALGSSVYLDQLSERISGEMGLGDDVIFYAFDAGPLLGLVYDEELIFVDPGELGEEVSQAFEEMLKRDEGVVSYSFRGQERTVIYRKSPYTDWWYAFGTL